MEETGVISNLILPDQAGQYSPILSCTRKAPCSGRCQVPDLWLQLFDTRLRYTPRPSILFLEKRRKKPNTCVLRSIRQVCIIYQ